MLLDQLFSLVVEVLESLKYVQLAMTERSSGG
jgi:hypothetical protein